MKPVLKWVGGKSQILGQVLATMPKTIHRYIEPFVGGGSVLLGVLQADDLTVDSIHASDANPWLIRLYCDIKNDPNALIEALTVLCDQFLNCPEAPTRASRVVPNPTSLLQALESREAYYYWCRKQFNTIWQTKTASLQSSALFLFLNKTCFRGVYREGPHGFNVPYGNYKSPAIFDADHILAVSGLLQRVEFAVQDFSLACDMATAGDFVYMDPPYVPLDANSFVGYTKDGFGMDKHEAVFKTYRALQRRGCRVVMSNADAPLVREAFAHETILTVDCKRSINSKDPSQKVNEVLIVG